MIENYGLLWERKYVNFGAPRKKGDFAWHQPEGGWNRLQGADRYLRSVR